MSLFLLLPILVSCGDDGTGPKVKGIGEDGGTVTLAGGSVTLYVPPGALSSFVEFTATPTQSVPASDLYLPGSAYEIGPSGTFFEEPATLTLAYDPATLFGGILEPELRLHRLVGSSWIRAADPAVDTNENTVSGAIDYVGRFGVLGLPVATVDVSPTSYTLEVGETKQLNAVTKGPSGELLAGRILTWTSNNESVATVDSLGFVAARGAGTATIKALFEGQSSAVTIRVLDCSAQSEIPTTECRALITVYDAVSERGWRNFRWRADENDPCEWWGVTCEGGSVTELDLGYQLEGSIPHYLKDLPNLTRLDLSVNRLHGSIPSSIGTLAKLEYLLLGSNDLSGNIPPQLGNLSNLRELTLYSNSLSGPIPPELGNLSNLTDLRLNSNGLSGSIPPELGNMSSLETLALTGNQISGPIPPELGELVNLESMGLSFNELSGGIPPELGNLSNLTGLGLTDNQLIGSIPPELGNLSKLTLIALHDNQLAGSVPLSFAQIGGKIQFDHSPLDCRFISPGYTGLSMPDTQEYRDADLDGDGKICFLSIGS